MRDTAVAGMARRERVAAAFRGAPVDYPPVTFWQHSPGRDLRAESLAAATVELAGAFDLDLIRLVPTGMYSVMDYGMETRLATDGSGSTEFVSGPIKRPEDWRRLPPVTARAGQLGEQVRAVALVREALGPDVPILQTVFSPLTMAVKLAGGKLGPLILESGDAIHDALARMAADVAAFGAACLDSGADGIFFLCIHANESVDRAVYEALGVPYDLRVLTALRERAWGIMLHIHGRGPYFDLANRYPVDAVSWEDRETEPSLRDALALTSRCLTGGIGRVDPLVTGSSSDVTAQVEAVLAATGERRIVVAPGCTLPHGVQEENLRALVAAVRGGE